MNYTLDRRDSALTKKDDKIKTHETYVDKLKKKFNMDVKKYTEEKEKEIVELRN